MVLRTLVSQVAININKALFTFAELLDGLKTRYPVFRPNDRSSYSNIGYSLLGLALARLTKKTYEQSVQQTILSPLNLSSTGFTKPSDSSGIIPGASNAWATELFADNP